MESTLSPHNAQKWANALRSGKFKQGTNALQTKDGKLCCLGVACKIFIPKSKQIMDREFKRLIGVMPHSQLHAPQWLKEINGDLYDKLGLGFNELNDAEEFSFNEIADIIELVYVHKALD